MLLFYKPKGVSMIPSMNEYLYTLDELLDDVELNERMSERLACSVFAVGKQMGWGVAIGYDNAGDLLVDVYR